MVTAAFSSTVTDDLSAHSGYITAVDTEFQKYYDSIIQMEGDVYGEGQDYIWSIGNGKFRRKCCAEIEEV